MEKGKRDFSSWITSIGFLFCCLSPPLIDLKLRTQKKRERKKGGVIQKYNGSEIGMHK
jgi:hypothetical protein